MTEFAFKMVGALMWLPDLCKGGSFALAYRLEDNTSDPWTSRVNRLKFGLPGPRKDAAIAASTAVLIKALRGIDQGAKRVGMTAACGHADKLLDPNGYLARIGKSVAEGIGVPWIPDLFGHRPHQALKTIRSLAEREAIVDKSYSARECPGFDLILGLDDFSTAGGTLREMERAVSVGNPHATFRGVLLAKNETQAYWQRTGRSVTNDHVPSELADLWEQIEGSA